ncbi:MAG: cytochrome c family protein [Sedimentisphaerales bacterium]|nr:cytochrome c family protein [Sedimentisphaerales bacterium]
MAVGYVLAAGWSCPAPVSRGPAASAERGDDVVLFFTGSEQGALKPCGCSGGQLGGLEKRTSIFGRVPPGRRLVVDTGGLVAGDREQDLIKFRILFEAYGLLGYDLVHLTARDLEIAASLNMRTDAERPFDIIRAGAAEKGRSGPFVKEFDTAGGQLAVNVAALDLQGDRIRQAGDLFPPAGGAKALNILILSDHGGISAQDLIAAAPDAIDCIVYPAEFDEPQLLSEPGERPLVFSVGRFGRHICKLNVKAGGQAGQSAMQFEDIPVTADLPDDLALGQLYRYYQQFVKDSGLLENYPRLPLPDDLTYVGSTTCKKCHEYEYERWATKAHADAFATLERVGSDYDPECVVCHVVGMEYASGFVTSERTPQFKDVGCENCHGPGSEHTSSFGVTGTAEPKMTCLQCHTPEHSSGYAGHEAEFLEKITHWREP